MRITAFLALLVALVAMLAEPLAAQQSERARERENRERIERVERQVRQMQRQVYPDGRPADTAGFYDDPVASRSSVDVLTGRVDALERQITELVRANEEAQYRLGQMEADIARMRVAQEMNESDARARRNDSRMAPPASDIPNADDGPDADDGDMGADADDAMGADLISRPRYENTQPAAPVATPVEPIRPADASDPGYDAQGEEAYTAGFRAWEAGNHDEAITLLRAMETSYPDHRRASFARNLIGRALLDKGEPRAAAQALLANYRGDPEGERAADSLYFLGQSLMMLNQPGQACRAYDELEEVYGGQMRPFLTQNLPTARANASCN